MINKLPEKLINLRKHFGLSQADIARKLNVAVTEYLDWENGNRICTIAQLKILADLYDVKLDDLADNTVTVEPAPILEHDVIVPRTGFVSEADTQKVAVEVEDTAEDLNHTIAVDRTGFVETKQEETTQDKKPVRKLKKNANIMIAAIAGVSILIVVLLIFLLSGKASNTPLELTNVNRLAEGDKYTLYIDKSGELKVHGQFNPLDTFDSLVQVSAAGEHALGLKANGTVVSSDGNQAVTRWKNIVMIAAGPSHSVGLTKNGQVECIGSDKACKVDGWKNIRSIYAGKDMTVGIDENGDVHVSGDNEAVFTDVKNLKDLAITDGYIAMVKEDGTAVASVLGNSTPLNISSWTEINRIVAGTHALLGLKADGTVTSIGLDEASDREINTWSEIRYIAAYGSTFVCVDSSGTLFGVGDNSYGQYVRNEEEKPEPVKLAQVTNISAEATTANISIKWDAVEHADYYEVEISNVDNGKFTTVSNSTSIPLTDLVSGKKYKIAVTACADDAQLYLPSDKAEISYKYKPKTIKLSAPGNISSGGAANGIWTVYWDDVEHADYYMVSVEGGEAVRADKASIEIPDSGLTSGTSYAISVTAYANDAELYSVSDAGTATLQYIFVKQKFMITLNYYTDGDTNHTVYTTKQEFEPGTYRAEDYLEGKYALLATQSTFTVTQDEVFYFEVKENTD